MFFKISFQECTHDGCSHPLWITPARAPKGGPQWATRAGHSGARKAPAQPGNLKDEARCVTSIRRARPSVGRPRTRCAPTGGPSCPFGTGLRPHLGSLPPSSLRRAASRSLHAREKAPYGRPTGLGLPTPWGPSDFLPCAPVSCDLVRVVGRG